MTMNNIYTNVVLSLLSLTSSTVSELSLLVAEVFCFENKKNHNNKGRLLWISDATTKGNFPLIFPLNALHPVPNWKALVEK